MKAGDTIDNKYRLVRLLGQGGMGKVFEALHLVTGRRLAVKCLHDAFRQNPDVLARFLREAQTATAIGSEHIVEVTDAGAGGVPGNPPYLVMELLEGESLAQILGQEGALEVGRALDLILQTCEALAEAHDAGIVHRDIKPDNLFVTRRKDGREWVKVLDFGIAKFESLVLTTAGSTLGTPFYMAPEQFGSAERADALCDVYSLGVVFYQALTGRLPYESVSLAELFGRMASSNFPPPRELRPELDAELETVVLRAMSYEPSARPASIRELARLLRASLGTSDSDDDATLREPSPEVQLPPTLHAASTVPLTARGALPHTEPVMPSPQRALPATRPASRPTDRRRGFLALGVVLAGLAVGGLAVGGWLSRRGPPDQREPEPEQDVRLTIPVLPPPPAEPMPLVPVAPSPPPSVPLPVAAPSGPTLRSPWASIAPGHFLMGSPAAEQGRERDEARHQVTLTRPFMLKTTEVTQEEWARVLGRNPSYFRDCGPNCPVEQVNWFEAVAFCNALSRAAGLEECYELTGCTGRPGENMTCRSVTWPRGPDCRGYRLPTEAEWEYAARAGTTTSTYRGDLILEDVAEDQVEQVLGPIAWFGGNSRIVPHEVGTKTANAWGLHDLLGNVWEWVWDPYTEFTKRPRTDPQGKPGSRYHVARGGGGGDIKTCRAAARNFATSNYRHRFLGFRVAQTKH